ncbi:MAG: flagellar motor protein MotB [Amaricoccus sp.]|uniref:flagellar motor protein MotB n=1 Tax=Amaricoccus sp. TaxID=1872485 RepID=UPI0039E50E6D
MEKGGNVIIVKRKNVIAGGHHGGAWKVAYADFVTAMMAFFLLMWLLSTTDEKTKLGLADYFSPTIPISDSRSGGDAPFEGDSVLSQDTLKRDETGQKGDPAKDSLAGSKADGSDASLYDVEQALLGGSGDAMQADPMLEHIRTRVTDEGLIVEVFDTPGSPLFAADGAVPNPIFGRLVGMIGRVLSRTENPVAITGNLAKGDTGRGGPDPWRLSSDRAQLARASLVAAGVDDARLARVTGKADRSPATEDPHDSRNRRIEITLLRHFPE